MSRLDRLAVSDEFEILRWCSSLVRKSASGRELELAHFTVKEFLLGIDCNSEFSAYRVDVEESELELGKTCLTYLSLQDFNSRIPWNREAQLKRYQEYAFRSYAVENWLLHARSRLGDPDLLTLIQKLLDPSEPGTFTTWTQDHQFSFGLSDQFSSAISVTPEDHSYRYTTVATMTPLHYASAFALPEICKWLLDCGCKVDHMSRFGTPISHDLLGFCSLIQYWSNYHSQHWFNEREEELCLKVVEILLKAGADPNSKSITGYPLLHCASMYQDITIRLLQSGARYDVENAYCQEWQPRGAKALLNKIGRENLHEDDYAFLLQCSIEENHRPKGQTIVREYG